MWCGPWGAEVYFTVLDHVVQDVTHAHDVEDLADVAAHLDVLYLLPVLTIV